MLKPFLIGLLLLPATGFGQEQGDPVAKPLCGFRAPLVQALSELYGEKQTEVTVLDDNRVAELFRNPDTGTWTIMITYARPAASCLVESGREGVRS